MKVTPLLEGGRNCRNIRYIVFGDPQQLQPPKTLSLCECLGILRDSYGHLMKTLSLSRCHRTDWDFTYLADVVMKLLSSKGKVKGFCDGPLTVLPLRSMSFAKCLGEICEVYLSMVVSCGKQNVKMLSPFKEDCRQICCGVKGGEMSVQEGDVFMFTRNDYKKDVFNGDEVVISSISDNILTTPKGKFSREYMEEFAIPSSCITTHKSQGEEWDHVILIIPRHKRDNSFITRRLVYTAITRGKTSLTLFI
jgi:hypothetical protein